LSFCVLVHDVLVEVPLSTSTATNPSSAEAFDALA
jgi:hypothetical protein